MSKIKTVLPFILLLLTQPLAAQQTVTLKVVVDSIQTLKGNILVAVYNSREGYNTSNAFLAKKIKVTGSKGIVAFDLKANTSCAVALFQDINENDTLDTRGSMKIPTEPFGFSNNRRGAFGPPGFSKISLVVASDTTININLISTRKNYFKTDN